MATSSVSTSSNDHHNLDNLPDLVNYHVLKNLDLDDLWRLRLVSKKLYGIAKSHKIYELTLDQCNDNWYSTTESRKRGYQLHRSKYRRLFNQTNNLLDLKYLRIPGFYRSPIKLDLNKFTKLQILEVGTMQWYSNSTLKLPDLKALDIRFECWCYCKKNDVSLMIDTPKLHSLSVLIYGENPIDNMIKFNHPQSVKHLRLHNYDNNAPIFTNLESLELCYILSFASSGDKFKPDDLMKFNNLKKLRISRNYFKRDELVDLFKSKKNDLEMVLGGVRLKEINKIDENEGKKWQIEFQLNNCGELDDDLYFVTHIDYSELVRLLPNQPTNLLTKYTNIQWLKINSRIEDDNRLIHFISGCSNLNKLSIENSSLNQQFYDQLPTISLLSWFTMYNEDRNLNFEFLMKMPYLSFFGTDQDVLLSKQLNLNNVRHLSWLEFEIENQEISIYKESRNKYHFSYEKSNPPVYKHVNHNGLVKWCNWVRNTRETRSSNRKRKLEISL